MLNGKPVCLELSLVLTSTYSHESFRSALNDTIALGRVVLQRSYERALLEGWPDIDAVLLHRMFDTLQFEDVALTFDESVLMVRDYAVKQNQMELGTSVGPGEEIRREYLRLPGWEISLTDNGREFIEELLEQDFRMHDSLIKAATLYLEARAKPSRQEDVDVYDAAWGNENGYEDLDDFVDR